MCVHTSNLNSRHFCSLTYKSEEIIQSTLCPTISQHRDFTKQAGGRYVGTIRKNPFPFWIPRTLRTMPARELESCPLHRLPEGVDRDIFKSYRSPLQATSSCYLINMFSQSFYLDLSLQKKFLLKKDDML